MTSTAIRTSPVPRGKYVMEVLLGTPPPPKPANVPELPENAESRTGHVAKPLSVRARLEEHRKNPACAGCHRMMDPIGFSLENYDVLGVWRTNGSGFRIDASGTMFDGAKLNGPASLQEALAHPFRFVPANIRGKSFGIRSRSRVGAVRHAGGPIGKKDAGRSKRSVLRAFVLAIVKSAPHSR